IDAMTGPDEFLAQLPSLFEAGPGVFAGTLRVVIQGVSLCEDSGLLEQPNPFELPGPRLEALRLPVPRKVFQQVAVGIDRDAKLRWPGLPGYLPEHIGKLLAKSPDSLHDQVFVFHCPVAMHAGIDGRDRQRADEGRDELAPSPAVAA